jgi:crescentin
MAAEILQFFRQTAENVPPAKQLVYHNILPLTFHLPTEIQIPLGCINRVIRRRFGRANRRLGDHPMSKFGGFFARKAGLYDRPAEPTPSATPQTDNPLELDEELFTALGAQLGGENESLRNLLLDANAKIGELDTIKNAVGKLVDPVSKALRAFEAEKSEKISLQTVLNNTRTAYGKLRNEVAELEKKANFSEKECQALRQELTTTQNLLRTLEATKAEIAIDIAARRAQIVDLEARLAQETGEGKALREENRRLDERLSTTDKRAMALDSEVNGARQRLLMLEDEKRAQQISLDKISAEAARLSRKLAETEANLTATQGRLRHVDGTVAELNTERTRLTTALDEANERHEHELTTQRMRFDTLQARASASEKLLGEAREHLLGRADEIRTYDRRAGELALERDALQARVADLEAERIQRESQFREVDQARATLVERSTALARAFTAKEAALTRAEDAIAALNDQIAALEAARATEKQAADQRIEELGTSLRREQMQCSVVEGALETARKDFARLMREAMALQREQAQPDNPALLRPANAA